MSASQVKIYKICRQNPWAFSKRKTPGGASCACHPSTSGIKAYSHS